MYETPEVLELGEVSELTLGRRMGDWSDGIPDRWTWVKAAEEVEAEAV